MMEEHPFESAVEPTTAGRAVFEFLFINRVSIAVISAVLLIAIATLPNVGVMIGWAFLLTALLLGVRQRSFAGIGFRRPDSWPRTLLLGLGLGVGLQFVFVLLIDPLVEKLTGTVVDISTLDGMRGHVVNYLIMLVIGWVVGGFLEEMLFRGYLLKRLKRVFGDGGVAVGLAILLPAIAFGMAHSYQGFAGMVSTGLVGLILGIIFVANGYNLWLPILVHGSLDMAGLTLIFLDVDKQLSRLLFG
jgi:membrane protease YdiL (CAAX protease family)